MFKNKKDRAREKPSNALKADQRWANAANQTRAAPGGGAPRKKKKQEYRRLSQKTSRRDFKEGDV